MKITQRSRIRSSSVCNFEGSQVREKKEVLYYLFDNVQCIPCNCLMLVLQKFQLKEYMPLSLSPRVLDLDLRPHGIIKANNEFRLQPQVFLLFIFEPMVRHPHSAQPVCSGEPPRMVHWPDLQQYQISRHAVFHHILPWWYDSRMLGLWRDRLRFHLAVVSMHGSRTA